MYSMLYKCIVWYINVLYAIQMYSMLYKCNPYCLNHVLIPPIQNYEFIIAYYTFIDHTIAYYTLIISYYTFI